MEELINIENKILSQKQGIIDGLGKMYYEEKIHEAKWYFLKMRRELNVDHEFKYLAYEKINWNEENYGKSGRLSIENILWVIAAIELDKELLI